MTRVRQADIRGHVTVKEPPVKAKPEVDALVLTSIDMASLEDSFMYVHCYFHNQWTGMLLRIWKTTFLIDPNSDSRSALLHAEHISYAPQWTLIPDGSTYSFLLIFSSLPKSCKVFDLLEDIPQPGSFHVKNIKRNEKDVYHIDIP